MEKPVGTESKTGEDDKGQRQKDKDKDKARQKRKRTERQHGEKKLSEAELLKKFADLDLTRFCPYCKNRGKRFNHPYGTCNWRPGGCWHGLKGEELRKARDKSFHDLKKSKAENRRANKVKVGETKVRTVII